MSELKERYKKQVVSRLVEEFQYGNPMQVPKLEKIVVNIGVGQAGQTGGDPKQLDSAMRDLSLITGQKPAVTRAKKSISNFKIRAGARIGCKVTLRGERMYEFLERLTAVAMPRIRDFNGVSPTSFDGRGNYALGIREQLIFPEIDYDKVDKIRGMDVCICTSAKTDEEARALLKGLGVPFRER